jgi:hypothetical protein
MLEQLLKRANLITRLRGAWRHDADEALKPVRTELRRLTREVEELSAPNSSSAPIRCRICRLAAA